MTELPTGTVTLLFTDVEGSTRLLRELGRDRYVEALEAYRLLLREACTGRGGVEVEMQGDSFHFAFMTAHEAVAAAADAQRALAGHAWQGEPIRARIGLHTGEPIRRGRLFAGLDVHRAARIMGAAHGGQVLLSQATRELVSGDLELLDLGEHRLKDLSEPERIYQLLVEGLPNRFPPPRSLSNTNLPTPSSRLVGRDRELAELLALLHREDTRLLTLTGTGGAGKTRLALEAAAELVDEYEQGVVWVPLAPLRDPGLVLPSIAQALGVKRDLHEDLADKRALLLLDNMEQLLEAGPSLAELLAACPRLELLVTSRECLHLAGEHEYPLPPLGERGAVDLFRERAQAAQPAFQANGEVAAICRALDGLPLAIELAAARVKLLSSAMLLERLERRLPLLTGGQRDLPERQKTLRATIAWSYDLLDEAERVLFARLSVFAGGFSLDAAEEICDADLDTLASLVDKSLVRRVDERFRMLETIREYASERLEESGEEEALRRAHAEFFAKLAQRADAALRTPEEASWLDRLEAEIGNLRAALHWSLEGAEPDSGLRLCPALTRFWFVRGHYVEADRWLGRATSRSAGASPLLQGPVLRAAGMAALQMGDDVKARTLLEQALTVARECGDRRTAALALRSLAIVARVQGELDRAIVLGEEALPLFRELGDSSLTADALHVLADIFRDKGDLLRARESFEESTCLFRESGNLLDAASTGHSLGDLAVDGEDLGRAEELYFESLGLARQFESGLLTAYCLAGLASAAAAGGSFERAARLWGAAEALESELGVQLPTSERTRYERLVRAACESEPEALAAGRELELEEALAYAVSGDRPA